MHLFFGDMPKLKDIIEAIEELAPPALAADWDNSGLQVGDPGAEIRKVLVALDPLPEVMLEAKSLGAELVVTHHPLFFRTLKSLDLSFGQGEVVKEAVGGHIAVYSAHTSLDRVRPGISDGLAAALKLKKVVPVEKADGWPTAYGFGRIGELPEELTVGDVASRLKAELGAKAARVIGDPERTVGRVAVCGGSGSDLIEKAYRAGAEAYVTGDVKYHEALKALELGVAVIDVGHFHGEIYFMKTFAGMLEKAFAKKGWKIKVGFSKVEKEPWVYI